MFYSSVSARCVTLFTIISFVLVSKNWKPLSNRGVSTRCSLNSVTLSRGTTPPKACRMSLQQLALVIDADVRHYLTFSCQTYQFVEQKRNSVIQVNVYSVNPDYADRDWQLCPQFEGERSRCSDLLWTLSGLPVNSNLELQYTLYVAKRLHK